MPNRTLHIALPVMGESDNLAQFFSCMQKQTFRNFKILVCVNQYESWWNNPHKLNYCLDNEKSLTFLKSKTDDVVIIDKSSIGLGWPDKRGGVGCARKVLMDRIAKEDKSGIIVSMDADSVYPENYLASVSSYFERYPDSVGLSVPYFHPLAGDDTDRHILRYEIYMRYYALNMLRIENPYCFTALGSAIALPVWAYKKIGGMTPVKSGEDFYLLQKLVKNGYVAKWVDTTVYPASRYSDRVLFGTGPALIRGAKGDWESYPFYQFLYFTLVKETFDLFPDLYDKEIPTPMTQFLEEQLKTNSLWRPLRNNYKDRDNFIKACRNKVDGLRILQFLKNQNKNSEPIQDEYVLKEFMQTYFAAEMDSGLQQILEKLSFSSSSIEELDMLRRFLYSQEMNLRKTMENMYS